MFNWIMLLNRRRAALLALVGGLVVLQAAQGAPPAGTSAPNILFLFSDDQRFDTIQTLGNKEIQTPHLDRLTREGLAFTRAHIMGAMQGAVCVPSRAMLLTGRSLFRCLAGSTANAIPPRLTTLPEALRQAGYHTIGVGKWHNDRPAYARAFAAGGPVFFGGMSDHTKIPVFDFDPAGKYSRNQMRTGEVFDTTLFADAAIRFLQEKREKPFFLYVAFTAPHDPRTPPESFAKQYDPDKIQLPKSFLAEHPFDNGELKVRDEKLLPWPRTAEAVRREIALYYGMISHLDAEIGRILKALEDAGRARDTIIVFAGDNGLAVGRHGLLGKQNLYEHSVRVPLIFSGPGIPKGKRSEALCYLFDVFPTLCELTGTAIPKTVEGRSLLPVIRGQEKQAREAVFGAYRDVQRMVSDGRWKLIHYPKANRVQLFDLKEDPDELKDLSADARHAAKLAELRGRLTMQQQEFGDPMLQTTLRQARRQ